MSDRETLLAALARDQFGLFTMAQARACGIPSSTVFDRTRSGAYENVHPGIYGVAGGAESWLRDVMAGVLSTAEPVAASHRTAAFLWGMTDRLPAEIEVVTRRHQRTPRRGLTIHESLDLRASDIVRIDSIPVTSAPRTVVDLGASARVGAVARCLDTGLRKNLFRLLDVELFVARVGRSGRTGVGTIRPLLDERRAWQGITDSDLEDMFRRIVERSPVAIPDAQHVVIEPDGTFVGRFDFAFPETQSLFELDSEGWHMDPVSFQRDREKQNRAHALGWTVYRFTYRQLRDAPDAVVAILASAEAAFQ
jgi:hypothetical protein